MIIHLLLKLLFSTIIYNPVSRITGSGLANLRPKSVYVLGVDLIWGEGHRIPQMDDFNYIVYDDNSIIAWESA